MALAQRSLPEEALELLDRNLADAREAKDSHSVAVFAKNAAVISSNVGDSQRAVDYYAEAIESQPGDDDLLIAWADEYERLGQEKRAREILSKCCEIALLEGDEVFTWDLTCERHCLASSDSFSSRNLERIPLPVLAGKNRARLLSWSPASP